MPAAPDGPAQTDRPTVGCGFHQPKQARHFGDRE
jgi:hypothetical protein